MSLCVCIAENQMRELAILFDIVHICMYLNIHFNKSTYKENKSFALWNRDAKIITNNIKLFCILKYYA